MSLQHTLCFFCQHRFRRVSKVKKKANHAFEGVGGGEQMNFCHDFRLGNEILYSR